MSSETDVRGNASDYLAAERTFLAWVRTAIAVVVFGFAIGRFAIAMRQLTELQGHALRTAGLSVWLGMSSILGGVAMVTAGLLTNEEIDQLLSDIQSPEFHAITGIHCAAWGRKPAK